ncbi:MAG: LapA family protein [candidate division WOR-3 bacterium]
MSTISCKSKETKIDFEKFLTTITMLADSEVGCRRRQSPLIWLIIISVLLTAIIVGGGVFWWQQMANRKSIIRLKTQITNLQKRINDLETKERALAELEKIFPVIENKLPDWSKIWQTMVLGFNCHSFSWQAETTITQELIPFNPEESSFQLRTPFYIYSPDKTKFLDIYIGMEVWEEAGKLKAGFGPDHGVGLGDLKTNQLKILLFCGTTGNYDNGLWLDNDQFVITGFAEYFSKSEEEKKVLDNKIYYVALLYFFNLARNKMTVYSGPKVEGKFFQRIYQRSLREQFRNKFPNIIFD